MYFNILENVFPLSKTMASNRIRIVAERDVKLNSEKRNVMTGSSNPNHLHKVFSIGDVVLCRFLLDAGMSVESRYQGCSLLYWSVLCGHADVCRLLIERGADVNAPEFDGKTPLHAAVAGDAGEGNIAICRMLLEAGAKVDGQDENGDTPLCLAKMTRQDDIGRLLDGVKKSDRATSKNEWRRTRDEMVHGAGQDGKVHFSAPPLEVMALMTSHCAIERAMHMELKKV